jgi:endo-1,4-beta-xylanase
MRAFLLIFMVFTSYFSKKIKIFAEEDDSMIVSTSFEDSKNTVFTPRGDTDTSVLTVKTDGGKTGDNYLAVTERSESWNGAQYDLAKTCTPGGQYLVSAWLKTQWYCNICLSMQYTDADGEDHYNNLKCIVSQGEWVEIKEYKFSMPGGCTNVYLYFENTSGNNDFYIDDFELKKAPEATIEEDIVSLKDAFKKHFKFGTATTVAEISPKTTQKLILKHFNSVTPGNELKPDGILDRARTLEEAEKTGDYTNPLVKIGGASPILDFCAENDIPVRGHTLVWHSQTPLWFFKEKFEEEGDWVDKDTMLKRMENYIKNVFDAVKEAYPTINFYAWDVVNEAWLDDGKPRAGGSNQQNNNNSPWVKIFGDNSFIKYAFKFARKYGIEGCKYYYNDYNEYIQGKTQAIINMVKELNAEETLIDGIGLQSHLDVNFPGISAYEKAVKLFTELGVDLQVTELDVTTSGNSAESFKKQAQYYGDIMKVLIKYSKYISAVVVWGTTDDQSWRASSYPLLFNEDYSAKQCFYSIVEGLE